MTRERPVNNLKKIQEESNAEEESLAALRKPEDFSFGDRKYVLPLTTVDFVPGFRVVGYKGIVNSSISTPSPVSPFRAETKFVFKELEVLAERLGANAVIGIRITTDISENPIDGKRWSSVSGIGTAVIVEVVDKT